MTTMQPYWEPRAEVRETTPALSPAPASGNRRLAWLAGTVLLAVTALNLGATAYLAGAIAELRGAEERLAKLSAFERRIMERLEVVNNGVQSQFDNMLQVTEGRMAELRRELELARAKAAGEATGSVGDTAVTAGFDGPPEATIEPAGAALVEAIAPAPRPRKTAAAPNPAYQRIEGPDGKVTYRKLR